MEGPFEYNEGGPPSMSVAEIWAHVQIAEPKVFWRLSTELNPADRADKESLLDWLLQEAPVLYNTLQNIVRTFQSAYHTASEARLAYLDHHHLYVLSCEATEGKGVKLVDLMEVHVEQQSSEISRKRRERETVPEELQDHVDNISRAMAKARKTDVLYYAQERYSNDFPLREYRHFTKKGKNRYSIGQIQDLGLWTQIFHCNGPWTAEQLCEKLNNEEGNYALVIKKMRGADVEVMGYKVLHGSFSAPPEFE